MTIHAYHDDIHVHGLADGCERCEQHAEHPERSLDREMLENLYERINQDLPARSRNEARAMAVVKAHRV